MKKKNDKNDEKDEVLTIDEAIKKILKIKNYEKENIKNKLEF